MDSTAEVSTLKPRLIVLIPEGAAGNPELAKKIYWMAQRSQRDVLYLALIAQPEDGFAVSRRMATMKALTSDAAVKAASRTAAAEDWPQALKNIYVPGDQIVCHAEQVVKTSFFQTVPLETWLSERYPGVILTLSGFYHPWQSLAWNLLLNLAFWLGCCVILGLFSFLEYRVDQALQGTARTFLLILLLTLEVGFVWIWNRFPKGN
jgi:hypothetical protein